MSKLEEKKPKKTTKFGQFLTLKIKIFNEEATGQCFSMKTMIVSICKPQIPKQLLPADKDHLIDGACAPYVITFLSAGLHNISRYPLFYLSSVYSSASLCCCDMIMQGKKMLQLVLFLLIHWASLR